MNLALWLLAMFALGILAMGLCYLFLIACEKIKIEGEIHWFPPSRDGSHHRRFAFSAGRGSRTPRGAPRPHPVRGLNRSTMTLIDERVTL